MRQILRRLRHLLTDESGDVLVLGAVGMVTIVAFAGLAIDIGRARLLKRQLQAYADSAAMAGVLELGNCAGTADCTNMQNAVKKALVENGISATNITLVTQCATSSATPVILTLNNGPCALGSTASDPHYGSTAYVETQVSQSLSTMFAGVIGISSIPITVRSEAGQNNSQYCLYTSAQPSQQSSTGILINGGGSISSSCGIYDDSTSGSALSTNPTTVTSSGFNVVGGWSPDNGGTTGFTPVPTTSAASVSDPLNYLNSETPTAGSCTDTNLTITGTTTLSHGTYCGGINLNSGSGAYTVTLNSGTYIFTGSVNVDTAVTLTGSNVTLYFSSGALVMNSASTVTLTAPTTGSYAGILIWQSTSDTTPMILNDKTSSSLQGAIYLPDAQLTVNGGANAAAYTILDVGSLVLNSSFTLGNNYSSLSNGSPAKSGAVLME